MPKNKIRESVYRYKLQVLNELYNYTESKWARTTQTV